MTRFALLVSAVLAPCTYFPCICSAQGSFEVINSPLFSLSPENHSAGTLFGWSAGFHNGEALVGALRGNGTGTVSRFDPATGSPITPTISNPTPQSLDGFGAEFASFGQHLVVGDGNHNIGRLDNGGIAYLMDPVTNSRVHTYNNPEPEQYDNFGRGLGVIDANRVVIGSPFRGDEAHNTGKAYVYEKFGNSPIATLRNPTRGTGDNFGYSAVSFNDKIFLSAPGDDNSAVNAGAVHAFDANTYQHLHSWTSPRGAAQDHFGWSLSAFGDQLLVGAPGSRELGGQGATMSGAAYLFDTNSFSATPTQTFTSPTASIGDNFGLSFATANDRIFIGSPLDDSAGTDFGRIYEFAPSSNDPVRAFQNSDGMQRDLLGGSLAVEGNRLLAGGAGSGVSGQNSGTAVVFDGHQSPSPEGPRTHVLALAVDDSRSRTGNQVSAVWGGGAQRVAQAFAPFTNGGIVSSLPLFDTDIGNDVRIAQAFNAVLDQVQPGDNFVFYFTSHGSYDRAGDETAVTSQFTDFLGRTQDQVQTGDERVRIGVNADGSNAYLTDDTLTSWLSRDELNGVQKLVVADSCYGGGFYSNFPSSADDGDLESLDQEELTFIALAPESLEGHGYYDGIVSAVDSDALDEYFPLQSTRPIWPLLGQSLEYALSQVSAGQTLSNEELVTEVARLHRETLLVLSQRETLEERAVYIIDEFDMRGGLPVDAATVSSSVFVRGEGRFTMAAVPEPSSLLLSCVLLLSASLSCRISSYGGQQ